MSARALTHLEQLEAESIHIMREVVAETEKPGDALFGRQGFGGDAAPRPQGFLPGAGAVPVLHVDTTWKFRDMYALRDKVAKDSGMELIVYHNPEAQRLGINPFDHGSRHTDMWKTEGLKQALDTYGFDAAFGGRSPRRGEEPRQGSACSASAAPATAGIPRTSGRTVEPLQRH